LGPLQGADLSKVHVLDKQRFSAEHFILPDDLPLVENSVKEIQAKLVIVDPLTAFVKANTNADVTVRRVLKPLEEIAERYKLAILLVRHLRKSGAKNALYSGAGSIGIIASARSSLMVGKDPSSDDKFQHVLALNKSNMADAASLTYRTIKNHNGAITIEWLGDSQYSADDINAVECQANEHSVLREAMYVLYSILSEGSLPARVVIQSAKNAGIAERTLKRAKQELRVKSLKKGSGHGSLWFWCLPDDESLIRPLLNKDIGELMDRLIYGDEDVATKDGFWLFGDHTSRKKTKKSDGEDDMPAIK
jgi:hypothetical protein